MKFTVHIDGDDNNINNRNKKIINNNNQSDIDLNCITHSVVKRKSKFQVNSFCSAVDEMPSVFNTLGDDGHLLIFLKRFLQWAAIYQRLVSLREKRGFSVEQALEREQSKGLNAFDERR